MNRISLLAVSAALALHLVPAVARAQGAPPSPHAARVEALLSRMTLEEKVGQMTQVTLAAVAAEGSPQRDSVRLDPAKLREAVVNRQVGSILNNLSGALTLEGWHDAVRQIQELATKQTRLGIPVLYGIDAVHGVNYTRNATIFPHNIGLAATFNPALARRAAEITADEALASGLPWNFAPVLDVGRNPLWPRFYETFGEDTYLVSRMGREAVEGMQQSGRVAATMKHYLGYSAPLSGRDRTPAILTDRVVREHFLPPFREAVRAGARSVMVNSAEIDGEPLHASRYWLTDVLRGELGFDGVIVTDWEDIIYLHTRHKVAPTMKEAVRQAVEAGVDMSMTPYEYGFADHLVQLVREGTIPESRVDQSVRRILTLKADLGLLDAALPDPSLRARFGTEPSRQVALQAARESMTLLKNSGILPLRPDMKILVTGPAANSVSALNGGWSYTWQGNDESQFPDDAATVLEAIVKRARDARYVAGSGFTEGLDVAAAARAAAEVDVAVVVIGEQGYAEGMGNLQNLTLPEAQLRLVAAVQSTGTPTVLVLAEGRPRVIEPVAAGAEAILLAYWPGMEGAQAIAEVLFGEINPSGKLPFTYPRHPNDLTTYDHKYTESLSPHSNDVGGFNPQFEFGQGLSYTTFAYRDLRVGRGEVAPGDSVTVQVTVTNTGKRAGQESVLLFTRQHYGSLSPQVRRLRDFHKVALEPGESRQVTFTLSTDQLRYIGRDGKPVLDPGQFDVMIGGQTATFRVTGPSATAATARGR